MQKIMKIFSKFTYALMALSMVAVSCVQEETFKPGEEDDANCYGVYFPKQDASGFHEWDPADPSELEVKVSRKVATDAISVPFDIVTSDSIWVVEPKAIQFDAGQTDTTIVIKFDKAVIGEKYDGLTLEINDPKYASMYSSNATFFNFSVQKVKWNSLGEAVWHDAFISALYGVPHQPDLKIEVQERDDAKGVFRFKNVYGADYEFNDPGDYEEGDVWLVIDASDSSAVDMDYQFMGLTWGDGPFYLGSTYQFYKQYKGYTDEEMESKYDISKMLGTYDKVNNVISFPEGAAGIALPGYANPLEGYWWDADGEFYVIMPGGKLVDYSISLNPYETEEIEGENWAPIEIITGPDVDSIKYTVLQGALTQSQFDDEAAAIIRGDAEGINAVKADPEEGVVVFYTDTTSATYTIVAVAFDAKGNAQQYDRAEFGFVKAGDDIPVAASFTAASIPGYTKDNELVFSVFGKNITDVKIACAEYATMMANQEAYNKAIASLYNTKSLDAEAIEAVNGNGYTATMGGLLPGTKYVVMAYVFNGFTSDILFSVVTTSGEPKKIYRSWDEPDEDLVAEASAKGAEAFYGTYNYYARREGYYGDGDDDEYNDILRQPIGKVKIEDSGIPKEGPDEDGLYDEYVMVTGLFSPFVEYTGIADTLIFDVYDGIMYDMMQPVGAAFERYYAVAMPYESTYGPQKWNYSYIGAFAEEGYISFFNNSSYDCDGFGVIAFNDEEMTSAAGLLCAMHELLLVDPEVDEEEAPAAAKTSARRPSGTTKGRMFDLCPNHTRLNCVETEKGLRKSAIDRIKAQRKAASVKSNITPVNDIVVPAQRACGQTKVVFTPKQNASSASATFTKQLSSAKKVRR